MRKLSIKETVDRFGQLDEEREKKQQIKDKAKMKKLAKLNVKQKQQAEEREE